MLTLPLHSLQSVGGVRFAQPALAGSQSVGRAGYGARRFGHNRQMPIHGVAKVARSFGVGWGAWSRVGTEQPVNHHQYGALGCIARGTSPVAHPAQFPAQMPAYLSAHARLGLVSLVLRFSGLLHSAAGSFGFSQSGCKLIASAWVNHVVSHSPACTPSSNPSLNRSTNGRPPSPGRQYGVHFCRPGLGVLPLAPG
jgi:hypothetical protein